MRKIAGLRRVLQAGQKGRGGDWGGLARHLTAGQPANCNLHCSVHYKLRLEENCGQAVERRQAAVQR